MFHDAPSTIVSELLEPIKKNAVFQTRLIRFILIEVKYITFLTGTNLMLSLPHNVKLTVKSSNQKKMSDTRTP